MRASIFTIASLFVSSLLAVQPSWDEIRSIAEAQHEIVLLLIQQKEFDKVPQASQKIFDLPFPKDQEHRVVKEAQVLTDALLKHNRPAIAHSILDSALRCVSTPKAKAELHREKAYVFKHEGKADEAMKHFEMSVELEKQSGS